jgi:hypothetical protein
MAPRSNAPQVWTFWWPKQAHAGRAPSWKRAASKHRLDAHGIDQEKLVPRVRQRQSGEVNPTLNRALSLNHLHNHNLHLTHSLMGEWARVSIRDPGIPGSHRGLEARPQPPAELHLSPSFSTWRLRVAFWPGPRVYHSCATRGAHGAQRWLPAPQCGFRHSIRAARPVVVPPSGRARHEPNRVISVGRSPHASHCRPHDWYRLLSLAPADSIHSREGGASPWDGAKLVLN